VQGFVFRDGLLGREEGFERRLVFPPGEQFLSLAAEDVRQALAYFEVVGLTETTRRR